MKRQRFVNLLLAAACVFMTGVTLRQYSVPLVPRADAQGDRQAGPAGAPFATPLPLNLRAAPAAVRKAATAAIRAQLLAFGKDDYQTAIKYQSRNLRKNFPSVARFRQMITTTYPEFAHSKSVTFTDIRSDAKGEYAFVQVTLKGQDGVTINAIYNMIREGSGYKIDGVGGGSRPPLPAAPGTAIDV